MDVDFIVFGRVRKVWPAEACGMVVFLLHYLKNCAIFLPLVGFVRVDRLYENMVSKLGKNSEEVVFLH